jgi:predicted ribosomally synthesized peptide with SipW-like signal peptide
MSSNEEYVLVPKKTVRVSRARKFVIGAMALGAVAAVAGAGTFASFSASTTNSASFSTAKLVLTNKKEGASTTCFSGSTDDQGTTNQAANLDTNANGSCTALFNNVQLKPGVTQVVGVEISNQSTGSLNSLLQLWPSTCTDDSDAAGKGTREICQDLRIYIQEVNNFTANTHVSCVFPSDGTTGTNCTDFSKNDDLLSELASQATAASAYPATPIAIANGATKYYKVGVQLKSAGGFDANGNGLDNNKQNRTASFNLSWRLQEA